LSDILHGLCEQCHSRPTENGSSYCAACVLVAELAPPSSAPLHFPFPTWVFPPPLQEYAESFASAGPFPLSFVGGSILPVTAAAIGERRNLLVSADSDWVEPSIVWLVNVGLSGCGKTPVMEQIIRPLENLDMEAHVQFEREREEWRGLTDKERKTSGLMPYKRAWIRTDATIEALATDLSRKKDILCYYDEFSQWIGQLSGYTPKQGDTNRAKWLQLHTGKRLDRRRQGTGGDEIDIVIPNPRVSILGGIQPAVVHRLAGKDDDGMTYRFLFSYGDKVPKSQRIGATSGYAWWNSCVQWLTKLNVAVVPLTASGFQFVDEFDDRLVAEGVQSEVAAKMKTYAARLSSVVAHLWMFHEGVTLREVGEDDVERAAALCRYFVGQRELVEDKLVPINDGRITYSTVENVWAYILRRSKRDGRRLNQRDIQRGKPAGVVRSDVLKQVLAVLRDDGRIKWYQEGREMIVEVIGNE